MVSALNKKLLRDLYRLKGQVFTIALVVASGIGAYVTMQSTWASLNDSKTTYYDRYRFADVFVQLKRAPESLSDRVRALPGVASVSSRIVFDVMLPIEQLPEPATGRLVSLPAHGRPRLNDLHLTKGRLPAPGRADEVVVIQSFADAHSLEPGDHLPAVLNGALRDLHIVGMAMSPEFVIVANAGDLAPDEKRFAILWMRRSNIAPLLQMDGALNNIVLKLQPGASEEEVLANLDQLTEPYGGLGAVPRTRQASNFFLEGELQQLEASATVVPVIFLAVAAFLLNVVLSQLVGLQRQQLAVLKALGYSSRAVGMHYFALAAIIVLLGTAMGLPLGAYLGRALTEMYAIYFKFPTLVYRLDWDIAAVATSVSLAAGIGGALLAVRHVVSLPPAEAMKPPAPARYRRTFLDRMGLATLLGTSAMMIVRELRRRPARTLLSSLGIAASVGIVVLGRFGYDSFDYLLEGPFHLEQRGDLSVTFTESVDARAEREIASLPGVLDAEGLRIVPVRFRVGSRHRDSVINGLSDQPRLRHLVNRDAEVVALTNKGLAMSAKLGEVLGIKVGDKVQVEIREGQREKRSMTVTQFVDDAFGIQAYMKMSELHRLLGEERSLSLVNVKVDPLFTELVERRLKDLPKVAQVTRTDFLEQRFRESSGKYMLTMTLILAGFGAIIAVGVVYNNARVALAVRSRDLASLRVLGFTRREISAVLLGELAIQLLVAIPVGLVFGTYWAHAVMGMADPETYRLTVVISARSYAFAVLVAGSAGLVSALLVRRKLDRLDLIEVLKTRG